MTVPLVIPEPEAAQQLHVCTRTLRKAREQGRLKFVKIGRRICYTPDDLAEFIDSERQLAAQPRANVAPAPKSRANGRVVPFSQRG